MTAPVIRRSSTAVTLLDLATRAVQLLLLVLLVALVGQGRTGTALNALLMLAIALLPDVIWRTSGVRLNPVLAFLVALSPFLHAVGALGYYRSVPAFDQVAHAVSAALVAGAGYVVVQVADDEYDSIDVPGSLRFVFVLFFATAFGVLWEVLEFATGLLATVVGGEPLLAQYGVSDVVLDLVFNGIGAVLVATWGTSYFDGVRGLAGRHLDGGSGETGARGVDAEE